MDMVLDNNTQPFGVKKPNTFCGPKSQDGLNWFLSGIEGNHTKENIFSPPRKVTIKTLTFFQGESLNCFVSLTTNPCILDPLHRDICLHRTSTKV